jgi:hypothetical protein
MPMAGPGCRNASAPRHHRQPSRASRRLSAFGGPKQTSRRKAATRPVFQRPYLQDTIFAARRGAWNMTNFKLALIVSGAVNLGLIGWIIYTSSGQLSRSAPSNSQHSSSPPNCDSPEAVATIKSMALDEITKFRGLNSRALTYPAHFLSGELAPENLTIDSFRKRGMIGEAGSNCAAQISINAGKPAPDISVEYTIEPTTDGKTIVSAHFRSNF